MKVLFSDIRKTSFAILIKARTLKLLNLSRLDDSFAIFYHASLAIRMHTRIKKQKVMTSDLFLEADEALRVFGVKFQHFGIDQTVYKLMFMEHHTMNLLVFEGI